MTGQNNRLLWIDSFKGVSILGVVLIHSGAMSLGGFIGGISKYGSSFVQAFFVLSGFLTWESISKISTKMSVKIYCSWVLKKLIALAPLYYIAIILYSFITGGNQYWSGDLRPITIENLAAHTLFLHGLFPKYCNSILGVEWYIGVLAIFYLIAPFVCTYIDSLPKSLLVFVVANAFSIMISALARQFWTVDTYSYIYEGYFDTYGITAQIPSLLLGGVLFYLLKRCKGNCERLKRIVFSILTMCFSILIPVVNKVFQFKFISIPTLYGVIFFVFLFAQSIYPWKFVNNRVLAFIGKKSYGIYLFHGLFFSICSNLALFKIENDIVEWMFKYICVVFVSIILSSVLQWFIDLCFKRASYRLD